MNQKFEWLQALRGVAALMVLFFHLKPHWEAVPQLAFMAPAMHWGFSGVDIFFVLSGFVVHQSTRQLHLGASLRQYVLRRAARIYLTYWPILAAVAVLHFVVDGKPAPAAMWRSVLLLEPSIFKNWLPVAWSLTYELYFYVLLGLIMLFPPHRQSRLMLLLILATVAWNAGWLIARPDVVYGGGTPLRFLLTGYIIEFMTGALLSSAMLSARQEGREWIRRDTAPQWIIGGLACMVGGLAVGTTSVYFDRVEFMRSTTFGLVGVGGFLVAMALQQMQARAPQWLVRIGDHSFGLYLLHAPLLGMLGTLRYRASLVNAELAMAAALLTPVAIVLVSAIWFRLLEAPAIRLTRRLH